MSTYESYTNKPKIGASANIDICVFPSPNMHMPKCYINKIPRSMKIICFPARYLSEHAIICLVQNKRDIILLTPPLPKCTAVLSAELMYGYTT